MGGFSVYDKDAEHRRLRNLVNWIVQITLVAVLSVFLVQHLGDLVKIEGRSMEPSFISGDSVLIDKLSYVIFKPARFDVILFQNEEGTSKDYVKRIIGLPGETVQIIEGTVYIDGKSLTTDIYEDISLPGLAAGEITLGKDEYFVLGDNVESSEDSRFMNIGNVKSKQIKGKVWFLVSSLDRFGFVKFKG